METPIMELKQIVKRFGDNVVLDDVSIALERASAHSVIGYNGSGKSTLAKIMSGEQRADSGGVYFEGVLCENWDTVTAVAHGVILISEYTSLFPSETVYENMQNSLAGGSCGAFPIFTQRKRLLRELREFCRQYEIECAPRDRISELNNGDRVLLEFLRAKLLGARVLIVDEIDVALGSRHKEKIKRLIGELKDEGASVLYISHKLDMILAVADSVSLIQYSKITAIREKGSFEENDIVEMLFHNSLERAPKLHKRRGERVLSVERHSDGADFSLELYEGEILGITGFGRSDSTQFCDLLFGGREEEVTVMVGNRRVRGLRAEKVLENGIVLMSADFMHLSTFGGYSVCQNMLPFNVVKRVRSRERREEICQRYINILNIKAVPSAPIETLSLGHQRKVFIARSILSKGDVFIFDNPTDSIDSVSKLDIYNIVNELKTQGKGIVFISNDLQEILGISDRVITVRGLRVTGRFENNGISRKKLMDCLGPEESALPPKNPPE